VCHRANGCRYAQIVCAPTGSSGKTFTNFCTSKCLRALVQREAVLVHAATKRELCFSTCVPLGMSGRKRMR